MKHPSSTQLTRAKQEAGAMILHVQDVAHLLNCSPKAIRAKVDRRILPYRRLGGRICFLRSELEAFIFALPGTTLAEAQANLRLRSGEEMRR